MLALAPQKPYRLDPCPADERVCEWYDVPDAYAPSTTKSKTESETTDEDGITYQRCGGGRRVLRKKLSN